MKHIYRIIFNNGFFSVDEATLLNMVTARMVFYAETTFGDDKTLVHHYHAKGYMP